MTYLPDATLAYYSPRSESGRTVAYTIDAATTIFEQIRGRMFTQSIPRDYALLFPFSESRTVKLHMRFVPYDLGAIWIKDNIVQKSIVMNKWTGGGSGEADIVIETHPEVIDKISVGDYLFLQGGHNIKQLQKPKEIPTSPQY